MRRKVVGLSPDEVIAFFHLPNYLPLREMITRNLPGKGGPCIRLETPPPSVSQMPRHVGTPMSENPMRLLHEQLHLSNPLKQKCAEYYKKKTSS
jgi:hypothetical protein